MVGVGLELGRCVPNLERESLLSNTPRMFLKRVFADTPPFQVHNEEIAFLVLYLPELRGLDLMLLLL